MTVNWDFITGSEGFKLQGYVPDAGNSGVTIATGFDLGQWTATALESLPPDLQARLEPYLGLRGSDARAELAAHPLAVSAAEAALMDRLAQAAITGPLIVHFQSAGTPFETLIDAAQTVCADLSFQYGAIWSRCPRFWTSAVVKDYKAMIEELRHFGDTYPTRRNREADYLAAALTQGEST